MQWTNKALNPDLHSDEHTNWPPGEPNHEHGREPSHPLPDGLSSSTGQGTNELYPGLGVGGEGTGRNTVAEADVYRELFPSPFSHGSSLDRRTGDGRAPSLPIVLISAACGITSGIIGLYISTNLFGLGIALSAAFTTLGLLLGLGVSGAALTAVTGERGAVVNIVFSCTLIALMVLFMTMCAVAGAALATFLVKA
ncbi:MAG: hypothetical protein ACK2UO_08810 [Caldilineaceae bacterium]